MDTLEPLHELLYSKLPPVPEESSSGTASSDDLYRSLSHNFLLPQTDLSKSQNTQSRNMSFYHSQPSSYIKTPQYNYPYSPPISYPSQSTKSNRQYPLYSPYQQLSPPPAPPSPPPQPEYILPIAPPTPPSCYSMTSPRMPMRSNSLPLTDKTPQTRREDDVFAVPKTKLRNRSRSGSCLVAAGKQPPPLLSTNSDSSLSVPSLSVSHSSASTQSALLAHLLTSNNAVGGFTGTGYSNNEQDKISGSISNLDSPYNYKQTSQTDLYRTSQERLASPRSVIYSNQSDNGTLNLSQNRSVMDRLGGQMTSHMSSVQLVSGSSSDNGTTTFTFGGITGSRRDNKPVPILPHPTSTATLLITPLTPSQSPAQIVGSASSSPKHPDSPSACESLSLSPLNVGSPGPQSPSQGSGGRGTYKEHKRVCHINAEQKRRCNIKNGFDTLHALIPQLNQNPNAKLSKAAMLQKGAEYIRQLRNERNQLKEEMDNLRGQVESLNSAISSSQSMLPASGAPVSRHRASKMKEMFDEYVRIRTQENWKFWILSLVCEPLLLSFNAQVSTQSLDELYRTTLQWVDQHCSLLDLRPVVLNALRNLCASTDFLSDPSRLPAEARAAVNKPNNS
uniref:BHLH domain-containing protein n=3 Tax=Clastoptera arizonana TaxID=38151 RepID=A0A1B6DC96_9HEMI